MGHALSERASTGSLFPESVAEAQGVELCGGPRGFGHALRLYRRAIAWIVKVANQAALVVNDLRLMLA